MVNLRQKDEEQKISNYMRKVFSRATEHKNRKHRAAEDGKRLFVDGNYTKDGYYHRPWTIHEKTNMVVS